MSCFHLSPYWPSWSHWPWLASGAPLPPIPLLKEDTTYLIHKIISFFNIIILVGMTPSLLVGLFQEVRLVLWALVGLNHPEINKISYSILQDMPTECFGCKVIHH